MTQRHKVSNRCWKNDANRLAQDTLAANLHFVKNQKTEQKQNATSVKHNKVKCNKVMCAVLITVWGKGTRTAHYEEHPSRLDIHIRLLWLASLQNGCSLSSL